MWEIILKYKIQIISAAISFLSAVFAFIQAKAAQKSYRMQQKVYEDGKAKFIINCISSSYSCIDSEYKNVCYFFEISITNLSDKSTSIKSAQLELVTNDISFIVNHADNAIVKEGNKILKIPLNIQPHTAISGWLAFKVPKDIYNKLNINTHYIILEDIHNLIRRKEEIYVMKERVKNEK